jgi:hypothetical protein
MTPVETINAAVTLWPESEASLAAALGVSHAKFRAWRGHAYRHTGKARGAAGGAPGSYRAPSEENARAVVFVVRAELQRRVNALTAHIAEEERASVRVGGPDEAA